MIGIPNHCPAPIIELTDRPGPGNRLLVLPPAAGELAQAAHAMLETLAMLDRHSAVAIPMADVATMIAIDRDRLSVALKALRA